LTQDYAFKSHLFIALYTIQIVSKQIYINKQEKNVSVYAEY